MTCSCIDHIDIQLQFFLPSNHSSQTQTYSKNVSGLQHQANPSMFTRNCGAVSLTSASVPKVRLDRGVSLAPPHLQNPAKLLGVYLRTRGWSHPKIWKWHHGAQPRAILLESTAWGKWGRTWILTASSVILPIILYAIWTCRMNQNPATDYRYKHPPLHPPFAIVTGISPSGRAWLFPI